jgi:hypothetical protein
MRDPNIEHNEGLGTLEGMSPNQTQLMGTSTGPDKKEGQYFEPTIFQFAIALCLFAGAIFASMEIMRLLHS